VTSDDWVKIIGAVGTSAVIILGAIGALWAKVHGYRGEVNGRMDELLTLTRSSAIAEGKLAGSDVKPLS
jgi:hypothetical protein